jgi:hypothetical protein
MKQTISGTYKTTHWREQEYGQVERGPKLTLAERESAIEGGLEGKGVLRYSVVHLGDGSSLFTGHERITGRLGDREGSFVVEDSGMGKANQASGRWKIIPESGSGDLVGLKGEGTWKWEGSEHVAYTLSYEL